MRFMIKSPKSNFRVLWRRVAVARVGATGTARTPWSSSRTATGARRGQTGSLRTLLRRDGVD